MHVHNIDPLFKFPRFVKLSPYRETVIGKDIRFFLCIGCVDEVVSTFLEDGEGTVFVSLKAGEVQGCVSVLILVVHL